MKDNKKYFFAVDLGATSGRTILGTLVDGQLEQEELTRFPNNLIETGGHFYWDIYALYFEMIKGLQIVGKRGVDITSIGIDTWGVVAQSDGLPRSAYLRTDGGVSEPCGRP